MQGSVAFEFWIRACRSDVWWWNVLDGFASRAEGGSCSVIGRYRQLCARSGGGVCRGMRWQPDGGWEPKHPATRTWETQGEVFPTDCRAKDEVINCQQTEGEDDLYHTDGRERAKTYFMPKVGLTVNYISQVFK